METPKLPLNGEQFDNVVKEISKLPIPLRREYTGYLNKYAGTAIEDMPNCNLEELPEGLQIIVNKYKN